jgi:hypothetical protein
VPFLVTPSVAELVQPQTGKLVMTHSAEVQSNHQPDPAPSRCFLGGVRREQFSARHGLRVPLHFWTVRKNAVYGQEIARNRGETATYARPFRPETQTSNALAPWKQGAARSKNAAVNERAINTQQGSPGQPS